MIVIDTSTSKRVTDANGNRFFEGYQKGYICSNCKIFFQGRPKCNILGEHYCRACGILLGYIHNKRTDKEIFFDDKRAKGYADDDIEVLYNLLFPKKGRKGKRGKYKVRKAKSSKYKKKGWSDKARQKMRERMAETHRLMNSGMSRRDAMIKAIQMEKAKAEVIISP